MGFLLNDPLMILSMGKVMMPFYGDFRISNLIISIVMKFNSVWYIYLDYISTLLFFPLSIVICNHIMASVLKLLNWL